MVSLEEVPVVEVHKNNFSELWPTLTSAVRTATFVAMDTELSGLGNRKLLNAKSMDDRYQHMCEVAKTRGIVSVGLSCFKLLPDPSEELLDESVVKEEVQKKTPVKKLHFEAQSFNIITLCNEHYVVEPASLQFLVEHSFDFNNQYAKGLSYYRGNDKEDVEPEPSLRQLFSVLLKTAIPVVFHNAVVDLVFLYESLYASLPTTNLAFLADLDEMFEAGIYDTKYITDFKARMTASYLEYVFKKCQRDNVTSSERGWSHIHLHVKDCPADLMDNILHVSCGHDSSKAAESLSVDQLCMQYANHGWCPSGLACQKSHDIDLILDSQDQSASRKHKKRQKQKDETKENQANDTTSKDCVGENNPPDGATNDKLHSSGNAVKNKTKDGCHTAGFDAFITGYIFAFFSARYGKQVNSGITADKSYELLGMKEYQNKVYLVGKDIPLQIAKSSFAKSSKHHRAKMQKLGMP